MSQKTSQTPMDASHQNIETAPQGAEAQETATHDAHVGAPPAAAPAKTGDAEEAAPGPSAPVAAPAEEEEDPLIVAQREQEEKEKALAEAANIQSYDDPAMKVRKSYIYSVLFLMLNHLPLFCEVHHLPFSFLFQAFYSDMKEVDRENEVNRILGAFKLNPYEMLGLRFDATDEDVRRAYRKVSLAVHPDKCTHPRAKDAFEVIGHAQKELLNEEKRKALDFLLGVAKEEVQKEWKKAAKNDAAARLAAVLDESGKSGVQAAWEQTPEFHEAWKVKARDVLAKAEWRRRKMTKRVKEEEERAKTEHTQEKEEHKKKRDADKAWDHGREDRVGSWRTFVSGKSKKTKGGSAALGGYKPPKAKTNDEEKRYVQRPVGEQFRPPGSKK